MGRPKLTPKIAYNLAHALYDASGECDTRLESVIAQDPWEAYVYARLILKGPFPKAESAIAQDAYWAYSYATDVLEGPFPEGEPIIAQDSRFNSLYASLLLRTPEDRARFKEIQRWFTRS